MGLSAFACFVEIGSKLVSLKDIHPGIVFGPYGRIVQHIGSKYKYITGLHR